MYDTDVEQPPHRALGTTRSALQIDLIKTVAARRPTCGDGCTRI